MDDEAAFLEGKNLGEIPSIAHGEPHLRRQHRRRAGELQRHLKDVSGQRESERRAHRKDVGGDGQDQTDRVFVIRPISLHQSHETQEHKNRARCFEPHEQNLLVN